MAVERANPLPPNRRYWVDVSPADRPAFEGWLAAYRHALRIVSTKRDANAWDWVLFEVTAPLVWWEGPGFPTIAGADVTSEDDVKQIPKVVTDPALLLEQAAARAAAGVTSGLLPTVLGLAVGAFVVSRLLK